MDVARPKPKPKPTKRVVKKKTTRKRVAKKVTRKSKAAESPLEALGRRIELPPVTKWLSTGCTILDLAIANQLPGGVPAGQISHVYGMESAAKTVVMSEPLGAAQRMGGKAFFEDVEETCDFDRLPLFGVTCGEDPFRSTKLWEYGRPTTIEDLWDRVIMDACDGCDPGVPNIMGIDSLSALASLQEMDESLSKNTMGTSRAKQLSRAFRKYLSNLSRANLALFFVDQSRMSLGGGTFFSGPEEVVSGGKALKFYTSVRIHMKASTAIKTENGVVIGMRFRFNIGKNKVAPPHRCGEFSLIFDYGIDDIATSLDWLKSTEDGANLATLVCIDCQHSVEVDKRVVAKEKSCAKCRGQVRKKRGGGGYDILGKHFKCVDDAIDHIETNGLEGDLQKVVEVRWHEFHASPERAPKRRLR